MGGMNLPNILRLVYFCILILLAIQSQQACLSGYEALQGTYNGDGLIVKIGSSGTFQIQIPAAARLMHFHIVKVDAENRYLILDENNLSLVDMKSDGSEAKVVSRLDVNAVSTIKQTSRGIEITLPSKQVYHLNIVENE